MTTATPSVILWIVVTSGLFSGCLEEFCGDSHAWTFGWVQPGAYEAFPPPGNETGYNIRHTQEGEFSYKMAERLFYDQVVVGLIVRPGNGSGFRVDAEMATHDPTQDEMHSLLRQVLEDLRLGEPAYSGKPEFDKEVEPC